MIDKKKAIINNVMLQVREQHLKNLAQKAVSTHDVALGSSNILGIHSEKDIVKYSKNLDFEVCGNIVVKAAKTYIS